MILRKYLPPVPAITYKWLRNLKFWLKVTTRGVALKQYLGQRAPSGGADHADIVWPVPVLIQRQPFGIPVERRNTKSRMPFLVIYFAICPCGLIYIGLTSRDLRQRVREHVLRMQLMKTTTQSWNQSSATLSKLRIRDMDCVLINSRGGDWKRTLAQRDVHWIFRLNTVTPNALNVWVLFHSYTFQ